MILSSPKFADTEHSAYSVLMCRKLTAHSPTQFVHHPCHQSLPAARECRHSASSLKNPMAYQEKTGDAAHPLPPKKPLAQFVTFLQLLGISVYINYMYTTMESFQFTCAFSVCVCWYTVTPPHQTRQDGPVRVVSGVNCTIAPNVFRLQIFSRRVVWNQFTPPKRTRRRLDTFCRVWRGGVN